MKQLGVTLGSITLPLIIFLSCSAFLFLMHTSSVFGASSLYITASKSEVTAGDRVIVEVRINATDQSINAVSGILLFPETLLQPIALGKEQTIINLWTREPAVGKGRIPFEGIVLNPGYQGSGGTIFRAVFDAKRSGKATISFIEGAVLANDGRGTNIVTTLSPAAISIIGEATMPLAGDGLGRRPLALPVITEYSASVGPGSVAYLRGKGEPNELTKIVFRDASFRSVGEQFIASLQPRKKKLDAVLVKNNENGEFEYQSPTNLVAGAYNATPFLVDEQTQTEKPGLGVQLLVNDSRLVRALVVLVNVLALLIPIVGLIVLIYFIPWYSFRRMRVIKRRLGLEEERLEVSTHEVKREDKLGEHATESLLSATANMPTEVTPPQMIIPESQEVSVHTITTKENSNTQLQNKENS